MTWPAGYIALENRVKNNQEIRFSFEVINTKEFGDIKGVIRFHISKKNRQHNGQKKKYKRTSHIIQVYITVTLVSEFYVLLYIVISMHIYQ